MLRFIFKNKEEEQEVTGDIKFSGKVEIDDAETDNEPVSLQQLTTGLAGKSNVGHTHTEADIVNLDKYTKAEVNSMFANAGGIKNLTVEESNPIDGENCDVNIMPNGQFWQYIEGEWEYLGELDLPTFSGKVLVLDSTNGNDLTAKKGSFEFRYKTFSQAYSEAIDDDTIIALNGSYNATSNIGSRGNLMIFLHNATLNIESTISLQDNKTISILGDGHSKIVQASSVLSNIVSITNKQNATLNISNVEIYDSRTGNSQIGTIRVRDSDNCKVNLKDVVFYTKSCPLFSSNASAVCYINAENVKFKNFEGTTLNNVVIALNTEFNFTRCEFEGYSQSDITSNYQYGGLVNIGPFAYTNIKGVFRDCSWNDLGTLAGLTITQNQANIRFEGTNTFKSLTATNSILKLTTVTGDAGNSIDISLAGEVTWSKPVGYNGADDNITWLRDNGTCVDYSYLSLTEDAIVTIPCSGRLVTNCTITQTNTNPIIQLDFPDTSTIQSGATGKLLVTRNSGANTWIIPPSGHYVAAGALNWANIGSGNTPVIRIQDDITPPTQARFTCVDHGLVTGDNISISGFTGNFAGYNRAFYVIRIDNDTFELDNTSYIPGATTGSPVFVKNIKVFNTGLEYANNTTALLEWEYTGSIFRWSVLRVLQQV